MALTYPYVFRLGANAGVDGIEYMHNQGKFVNGPVAPDRQFGIMGVIVNAAYQISDADQVIFVDASAAPVTVDLPGFSKYMQRFHLRIIKFDATANAVTVQRRTATSDTVNGGTSVNTVTQYHGFDCYCPTDSTSTGDGTGNGLWIAVACGT